MLFTYIKSYSVLDPTKNHVVKDTKYKAWVAMQRKPHKYAFADILPLSTTSQTSTFTTSSVAEDIIKSTKFYITIKQRYLT